MTQTMIQGMKAAQTSPRLGFGPAALGFGIVAAESSLPRRAGDSHSSFGVHTFLRKRIRQPIEMSEAPISTIHGLM
jgi:hypothetical protein